VFGNTAKQKSTVRGNESPCRKKTFWGRSPAEAALGALKGDKKKSPGCLRKKLISEKEKSETRRGKP